MRDLESRQLTVLPCHTLVTKLKGGHMRKYRQLNFEDRIFIEVWQSENIDQSTIANRLGVHRSTISREIRRGDNGLSRYQKSYRWTLGEGHKRDRVKSRGRPRKLVGDLRTVVLALIREDWSPEQICGRLRRERGIKLSHETIYSFIRRDRKAKGDLYLHLRHGRRRRKKRFAIPRVRADILNRLHISQRPDVINNRERIGDWERDLMFGQGRSEALLTIVERKTLLTMIRKVESKSPKEIAAKTISALSTQYCLSLTNDNGFEFREHKYESEALKVPIYFTNPYSSWEKGTCENINGLVRQYITRKNNLKEITNEQINKIEERLNNRPRKKLDFKTPNESINLGTTHQLCHFPGDVDRTVALFI